MFEAKPPAIPAAPTEADATERLTPIAWHELTARLTAARELAAQLGPEGSAADGPEASFDAGSALHLGERSATGWDEPRGQGKRDVNPAALGNGKDGMADRPPHHADRGAAVRGRL